MMNRLSTVLQNAADALTPPPPPLEDLRYHWKHVTRYYAQRSALDKTPIEETNISGHLEQLLQIVISEENNIHATTVGEIGPCIAAGPCLEYLLQQRLLEVLASLADADHPPGMRRYMFSFLCRFVDHLTPYLLTNARIHIPLIRLVNLCYESRASPTENEEIEFLVTICKLVAEYPHLSLIFNKELTVPPEQTLSLCSSASGSIRYLADPTLSPAVQSRTESLCEDPKESADVKLPQPNPVEIKLPFESELSDESATSKNFPGDSVSNIQSQVTTRTGTPESMLAITDAETEGARGEVDPNAEPEPDETHLPLLDAVLNYINSADSWTVQQACDGILLLLRAADATLATAVATKSRLGLVLADRLTAAYQQIPLFINSDHLQELPTPWTAPAEGRLGNLLMYMTCRLLISNVVGDNSASQKRQNSCCTANPACCCEIRVEERNLNPESAQAWLAERNFPGNRIVASLVTWLNFCDQLCLECPEDVSSSVACAIRALFLEVELEAELRSEDISRRLLVTNIICVCLRQLSSPALVTEMNLWLVGESREPDVPGVETCTVKQILLDQCVHMDPALSLATLQLFEILLEGGSEHVLHSLVLVYLEPRRYCLRACQREPGQIESWSDEEDAREQERIEQERRLEKDKADGTIKASPVSRTFAPANIHKIMSSFLLLLPTNLCSAQDYEEIGYQQYVGEAQRHYDAARLHCASFGWPFEATFPDYSSASSSDSRPEAEAAQADSEGRDDEQDRRTRFDQGPFLSMLISRIKALPDQPYELNLQLTALVSRLALLPHPHLHEYLLNPLLPFTPEAAESTLHSALRHAAAELQNRVTQISGYKRRLAETRLELLSEPPPPLAPETPGGYLLESVIVLEEFCKELAALAFVKYHHSS